MKANKRLALTDDKSRVVPYESKEARYLFAAEGQEIPDALAEKFGIVNGDIPVEDETSSGGSDDTGEDKPEDNEGEESEDNSAETSGPETADQEGDEVKAQDKPEDKKKGKPETKPIIKPETKRR